MTREMLRRSREQIAAAKALLQHKVRISGTLSFQNNRNLALSGMAKQEALAADLCSCNKAMVFMDAVRRTDLRASVRVR